MLGASASLLPAEVLQHFKVGKQHARADDLASTGLTGVWCLVFGMDGCSFFRHVCNVEVHWVRGSALGWGPGSATPAVSCGQGPVDTSVLLLGKKARQRVSYGDVAEGHSLSYKAGC